MNRLLTRLGSRKKSEGALGLVEWHGVGVHPLQRVLTRFYQADGALVVRVVDAEGAEDGQLFDDDPVAEEVGDGVAQPLGAGQYDAAAPAGEVDGERYSARGVGGDIDD